jgi:23S rRNA pseudouridine2605 synthase
MPRLRLNKILAQAGLTSRRGADDAVLAGRVAVNGVVTREPGTLADPAADRITVDGRPLPAPEPTRYLLLHKPAGVVSTVRDPHGRPVVTDLLPADLRERVYPVGRLDADVEGLLLLTNDGPLTHRLLHPRYALPRVYEAEVDGRVAAADLPRWRRGLMLDDGPAAPLAVALQRTGPLSSALRLTFTEGRKHEVKRYCDALGHRVRRLRRVAFGPLTLGALPVGACRRLTPAEIAALRSAADEHSGRALAVDARRPSGRGGGRRSPR